MADTFDNNEIEEFDSWAQGDDAEEGSDVTSAASSLDADIERLLDRAQEDVSAPGEQGVLFAGEGEGEDAAADPDDDDDDQHEDDAGDGLGDEIAPVAL